MARVVELCMKRSGWSARALLRVVKGSQLLVKITVHCIFQLLATLQSYSSLGIIRKGVKSAVYTNNN